MRPQQQNLLASELICTVLPVLVRLKAFTRQPLERQFRIRLDIEAIILLSIRSLYSTLLKDAPVLLIITTQRSA